MKNPFLEEIIKLLEQNFGSGTFTDKEEISSILKICSEFYFQKLDIETSKFDSKNLILRLIIKVDHLQLYERDQRVIQIEEALLLLIDLTLESYNESNSYISEVELDFLENLAVESLIYSSAYASHSGIYKEQSSLTLNLENPDLYFIHNVGLDLKGIDEWFRQRNFRNKELRSQFGDDFDLSQHSQIKFNMDLDKPFLNEFGIGICEFQLQLVELSQSYPEIENPNQVPSIGFDQIKLATRKSNLDFLKFIDLIDGLCISKDLKLKGKRKAWDYTQNERARNRPFVKIPNNNDFEYRFSPSLLAQRVIRLSEDIPLRYKERLPEEWKTDEIFKTVAHLHNKLGLWFESKCLDILKSNDLQGFKPTANSFPIGPPDIIAYSEKSTSISIFECKLLDQEFEARGIRNHISKFTDMPKGYIDKFSKKVQWAVENLSNIEEMFVKNAIHLDITKISKINFCFLTYYPAHIDFFYKDIPVPTVFEFSDKFSKNGGNWPFEKGVIEL